jgi:hypothetical protein
MGLERAFLNFECLLEFFVKLKELIFFLTHNFTREINGRCGIKFKNI